MVKLEVERTVQGLSKAELARRARVQPNVITWAEAGRYKPYPSQLRKLAGVLGVGDPDTLLDEAEAGYEPL